ncbi:MAG: hypothetical protein CYG60_05265 [Actinobacteria bacterium]|nr:MAG: hypothetical protein CYG60_05265 [Actinomycetota bacterium]
MDHGVGCEVKRLREKRGWSQARLAVEADMSVSGVSMIENGRRNLTTTTLAKLAVALGVQVADLFPKAEAPLPFEEDVPKQRRSSEAVRESYARLIEAWTKHVRSRARSWEEKLGPWEERPRLNRLPGADLWAKQVQEDAWAMVDTVRDLRLWEAGGEAKPLLGDLMHALVEMSGIARQVCTEIRRPEPHWGSVPDLQFIIWSLMGPYKSKTIWMKATEKEYENPENVRRLFEQEFEKLLPK